MVCVSVDVSRPEFRPLFIQVLNESQYLYATLAFIVDCNGSPASFDVDVCYWAVTAKEVFLCFASPSCEDWRHRYIELSKNFMVTK